MTANQFAIYPAGGGGGGSGAQGAQGAQGTTGSSGSANAPNNVTNNTYVGSGQTPTLPGATAADGQSSTATFSTDSMLFVVTVSTERDAIFLHTSYASADISAISDPGNLYLPSNTGVGIFISKSANSNTITVKNRMGGSRVITVQAINAAITSATVWA